MKYIFIITTLFTFINISQAQENPIVKYKLANKQIYQGESWKYCAKGCVKLFKKIPNTNTALIYMPNTIDVVSNDKLNDYYYFNVIGIKDGKRLARFYTPNPKGNFSDIWSMDISSDRKMFAVGGTGVVTIFNLITGSTIRQFKNIEWGLDVEFSEDNKLILFRSSEDFAEIYNIETGRKLCHIDSKDKYLGDLYSVGYTNKKNEIFIVDRDRKNPIYFVDVEKCIETKTANLNEIEYGVDITVFPKSNRLFISNFDDPAFIWNINKNKIEMYLKTHQIKHIGHQGEVTKSENFLFTSCDGVICIFDVKSGDLIYKKFFNNDNEVIYFELMENNKIITVYDNSEVLVWDTSFLNDKIGIIENTIQKLFSYFE